jgi:hypothetical protein
VDQDLAGADIRCGSEVNGQGFRDGDDPGATINQGFSCVFSWRRLPPLLVSPVFVMEGNSSSMESTLAETFRVTDAQRTKVYEFTLQHAQVFGIFKDMASTASRGDDPRPVIIIVCWN